MAKTCLLNMAFVVAACGPPLGGLPAGIIEWCFEHPDDVDAMAEEIGIHVVVTPSPSSNGGLTVSYLSNEDDVCREAYARSSASPSG